MRLVIVQQEHGKYLFEAPKDAYVYAGDRLVLDTARRVSHGTALCNVFEADAEVAKSIMSAFSTDEKRMKYVIGKALFYMFDDSTEGENRDGNV